MTVPVDALLGNGSCAAVADNRASATPAASERQRLQLLASEFESMLLNQVLQEMRRAGRWNDGEAESEDASGGFGHGALFEILDAEMAKQLSSAQGLGLGRQLMEAFDRLQGMSPEEIVRAAGAAASEPVAQLVGSNQSSSDPGSRIPSPGLELQGAASAASRQVTSGYGWRRDPFTGETRFHRGIDLRAAYGEDVAAPAAGRVAFSGAQGSYGNTVVVEHADGTRTRYAHLSVTLVRAGDIVEPGQLVGRAGSSGRATAPHIHMEVVDRQGRPVDPLNPRHPLD